MELKMHFERGQDYPARKTVFAPGWENAQQRNAYTEAIHSLTRGLALVVTLPQSRGRDQQELALQLALVGALVEGQNHGAPEVNHAYARAQVLGQGLGRDAPAILSAGRPGGVLLHAQRNNADRCSTRAAVSRGGATAATSNVAGERPRDLRGGVSRAGRFC